MTLNCTRVPSKRPQKQHTQRLDSNHNRAPTPNSSTSGTPMGGLQQTPGPAGQIPLKGSAPAQQLMYYDHAQSSQPARLRGNPTQGCANSNQVSSPQEAPHNPQCTHRGHSDQVIQETGTVGPTGHILHKATLQRLGDTVESYLIHKPT